MKRKIPSVTMLPHSDACERNKEPILEVLRREFAGCTHVLEVGSGTGQHRVHRFGSFLNPHIHFHRAAGLSTPPCSCRRGIGRASRDWCATAQGRR